MPGLPDHGALFLGASQDDVRQRLEMIRSQQRLDAPDAKREDKLREASQDFEAVFLHQLLKQMRATVPKEGMLHSRDGEFWQSHFDTEMSVLMARSGGIGLGAMIFDQLRETQVQASRTSGSTGAHIPAMTLLAPAEPGIDPEKISAQEIENRREVSHESTSEEKTPHAGAAGSVQSPHVFFGNAGISRNPGPYQMPGGNEAVDLVRSLADSIEKRGGIVPEHPGRADGTENAWEPVSTGPLPPMQWPMPGRISSGFGWRRDPFTGQQAWHAGVDLAAPSGTPVKAAWDGRVVFVGERGGYGNTVVLEHAGGWRTFYAHNQDNTVKVGDQVRAGAHVATVGSSGRSTGPHLHFEIRQGNVAWNPKQIRDRLLAGLPIGREDSA